MAAAPFNPVLTLPEDDDFASQYPLVARTFLDEIDSWIVTEHDRDGHHSLVTLPDQVADRPNGTDDMLTIWQEADVIYVRNAALGTLYTIPYYLYDAVAPGIPNTAFADMPERTIKGRAAGAGAGITVNLTAAQAAAVVAAFTPDTGAVVGLQGVVPASAIGDAAAGKFLTAAGTWAATGAPHAVLRDSKAPGTDAGTFTPGAWRTRGLNEELYDPYAIVTLASNQFTLQPGTYVIRWSSPAYHVNAHATALQNVTTGAGEISGTTELSNTAQTRSTGIARITIASANVFTIIHQAETTRATDGMGAASGFTQEIYTIVEIWKVG